jgi:hypothetical protein
LTTPEFGCLASIWSAPPRVLLRSHVKHVLNLTTLAMDTTLD